MERYSYTPYGDLTSLDPNNLTQRTSSLTRYTYTARELDPETSSYHFRARTYSPTLGRFTSHDPIMYPDGGNTYAGWFAVMQMDASGLAVTEDECNAAATAAMKDWGPIFDQDKKVACQKPKINCVNNCAAGVLGKTLPGDKKGGPGGGIEICTNTITGADELKQVIVHEIMHSLDSCYHAIFSDCNACVCSEIRAYSVDGGCTQNDEKAKWDCVQNKAKGSASTCPCQGDKRDLNQRLEDNKKKCFIPCQPAPWPSYPDWGGKP